jgi:hypothetical protein
MRPRAWRRLLLCVRRASTAPHSRASTARRAATPTRQTRTVRCFEGVNSSARDYLGCPALLWSAYRLDLVGARTADGIVEPLERHLIADVQIPIPPIDATFVEEGVTARRSDNSAPLAANQSLDATASRDTCLDELGTIELWQRIPPPPRRGACGLPGRTASMVHYFLLGSLARRFTCTRSTELFAVSLLPVCPSSQSDDRSGLVSSIARIGTASHCDAGVENYES